MEDFHSSYERKTIIDNLDVREKMREREPGEVCWWDRFRAGAGAPWEKGFKWGELGEKEEGEEDEDEDEDEEEEEGE